MEINEWMEERSSRKKSFEMTRRILRSRRQHQNAVKGSCNTLAFDAHEEMRGEEDNCCGLMGGEVCSGSGSDYSLVSATIRAIGVDRTSSLLTKVLTQKGGIINTVRYSVLNPVLYGDRAASLSVNKLPWLADLEKSNQWEPPAIYVLPIHADNYGICGRPLRNQES